MLVTGGENGIGAAIARHRAAESLVVVCRRMPKTIERRASEIGGLAFDS